MRRRGVPCGCTDNGGNGGCCGLKETLAILWDRTIGSILRINGISPDGDGDFTIEAGDNINLTETGTGNGIRIDTTGGVSYYSSGDTYVNVDNNDLEITVNAGFAGGLALQDDLDTVAGAVSDILDGTTTVPKATDATNATNATNATYLGSNTATVGSDAKPIKFVNGQAVEIDLPVVKYVDNNSSSVILPRIQINQEVIGNPIEIKSTIERPPSAITVLTLLTPSDANGTRLGNIYLRLLTDGSAQLWAETINADGTYSYKQLAP